MGVTCTGASAGPGRSSARCGDCRGSEEGGMAGRGLGGLLEAGGGGAMLAGRLMFRERFSCGC